MLWTVIFQCVSFFLHVSYKCQYLLALPPSTHWQHHTVTCSHTVSVLHIHQEVLITCQPHWGLFSAVKWQREEAIGLGVAGLGLQLQLQLQF